MAAFTRATRRPRRSWSSCPAFYATSLSSGRWSRGGPIPCFDQHVDGALDAVLGQEPRRAEARLGLELVGDHRASGVEGVACRRVEIGPKRGVADRTLPPAHAGAHEAGVLAGQVLQHLAEGCLQSLRAERRDRGSEGPRSRTQPGAPAAPGGTEARRRALRSPQGISRESRTTALSGPR